MRNWRFGARTNGIKSHEIASQTHVAAKYCPHTAHTHSYQLILFSVFLFFPIFRLNFSIVVDDIECTKHVQRIRKGILCAHEVHIDQAWMPLQIVWISGKHSVKNDEQLFSTTSPTLRSGNRRIEPFRVYASSQTNDGIEVARCAMRNEIAIKWFSPFTQLETITII